MMASLATARNDSSDDRSGTQRDDMHEEHQEDAIGYYFIWSTISQETTSSAILSYLNKPVE